MESFYERKNTREKKLTKEQKEERKKSGKKEKRKERKAERKKRGKKEKRKERKEERKKKFIITHISFRNKLAYVIKNLHDWFQQPFVFIQIWVTVCWHLPLFKFCPSSFNLFKCIVTPKEILKNGVSKSIGTSQLWFLSL